ncbi:MAG: dienelactone hydrolase family protein [Phreatobacter sp.]
MVSPRPTPLPPSRALKRLVLVLAIMLTGALPGLADERVQFPNLAGSATLTGFLTRPQTSEPAAAVVMLHGCSGLGGRNGPFAIYRAWRDLLAAQGYVVLMVDSAASRGFGQTCTASPDRLRMWAERPADAYAALAFLQRQPFVKPDRIALMGWSQGGGVVLLSIPLRSSGRPTPPPPQDFVAAIAFYPGACSDRLQSQPFVDAPPRSWTTAIPLLVLQGEADNWTPVAPCRAFLEGAQARQAPVTLQVYAGAAHGVDAVNVPVHAVENYRRNGWAPVVGTDVAARDDARGRVGDFLARYLKAEAR